MTLVWYGSFLVAGLVLSSLLYLLLYLLLMVLVAAGVSDVAVQPVLVVPTADVGVLIFILEGLCVILLDAMKVPYLSFLIKKLIDFLKRK